MQYFNLFMYKKTCFYLSLLVVVFLFAQCSKEDLQDLQQGIPTLPSNPYDYTSLPPAVPNAANDVNLFSNNPITNDGATLGRVLFYDTSLSKNNTISCASCHKQEFSFADNVAKSDGVNGKTIRNSMHLVNIRHFGGGLFWDGRAQTLEIQTLMPIQDHIEMDLTLSEMISKLQQKTFYPNLFKKAFGDESITSDRVSRALSQFIRTLNSYNSKFDRKVPRTAAEEAGFQKFFDFTGSTDAMQVSCTECHSGVQQVFFTDFGIPTLSFTLGSNGRGFEDEPNLMKVANLKNVELTAPYGHDGRFATLDVLLQNHGNNLTPADRANLIAFLKTLTDTSFINDVRYADPFK